MALVSFVVPKGAVPMGNGVRNSERSEEATPDIEILHRPAL